MALRGEVDFDLPERMEGGREREGGREGEGGRERRGVRKIDAKMKGGRMGLVPAVDFGGVHGVLCGGSVFGAFKSDETEAARACGVFSEGRGGMRWGHWLACWA